MPWANTAAEHRGDARRDGLARLLGADEVNMRVQTPGCDDLALASNNISTTAHNHVGRYAVHDIWVSCLADAHDDALLDANVGLVDARVVHDERVGDDHVQTLSIRTASRLSHALAQRLSAAKLALVAIHRHIPLDLNPEIRAPETDPITYRRSEHSSIRSALHHRRRQQDRIRRRLRHMREPRLLQPRHDVVDAPELDAARREVVPPADDLVPANLDQRDRLRVAGLEAHRRARGDVQTQAVGLGAVELQLGIRLDEVVVRPDLDRPVALARHLQLDPLPVLVDGDLPRDRHHGARLARGLVLGRHRHGEQALVRHGQEAPVQRAREVPVLGGDGVVHGDEVRARGERALDLDLAQRAGDRGEHVPATEHRRAERHEVGDGVLAIADELLEVARDEGLGEVLVSCGWLGALGAEDGRRRDGTVASEWFSLTPLARRLWARKPNCEMASLSSCSRDVHVSSVVLRRRGEAG